MKHEYLKDKKVQRDIYDFSGPLWEKYYKETRRTVKFPRGYKEVNLFNNLV